MFIFLVPTKRFHCSRKRKEKNVYALEICISNDILASDLFRGKSKGYDGHCLSHNTEVMKRNISVCFICNLSNSLIILLMNRYSFDLSHSFSHQLAKELGKEKNSISKVAIFYFQLNRHRRRYLPMVNVRSRFLSVPLHLTLLDAFDD